MALLGRFKGSHKEDEIIWIQGYQLMLVPSSLSRKLKTPTRIGIFFHTPFPSSDMFRILPCSALRSFFLTAQGARAFCTACWR